MIKNIPKIIFFIIICLVVIFSYKKQSYADTTCSLSNLSACLDESDCEAVGGIWNDNFCISQNDYDQILCNEDISKCYSETLCENAGYYWDSDKNTCIHKGVDINFGKLIPQRDWFNYCMDWYYNNPVAQISIPDKCKFNQDQSQNVSIAIAYLTGLLQDNKESPPVNLCDAGTPDICLSRDTGNSCGYDYWKLVNIKISDEKIQLIDNTPFPEGKTPFGYIDITAEITRQYDCNKVGLDCNGDGWLDCFNCKWRDKGYDCSGDCIADNDYTKCHKIKGWDCNLGDGCDTRDYNDCQYRKGGYDYNNDCIADFNSPEMCSNLVDGDTKRYIVDSEHPYYPCSEEYGNCGLAGIKCADDNCSQMYYDCYYYEYGQKVQEGYYCSVSGTVYNCSYDTIKTSCSFVSGYDCGTNGGEEGNQNPDNCIDNDITYCAHVTQGWDCSGCSPMSPAVSDNIMLNDRIDAGSCFSIQNLADSNCGVNANDKKYYYCSRYDFPGQCCQETKTKVLTITIQDYMNKHGNYYLCRMFEGQKMADKMVDNDSSIQLSDNYTSRLSSFAPYAIDYNNPDTQVDDSVRFITEGCRNVYNKVVYDSNSTSNTKTFTDSGSGLILNEQMYKDTFVDNLQWKFINYGEFLYEAAKNTCQWRDYLKKCYCSSVGSSSYIELDTMQNYVFYEDLKNPTTKIINTTN